MGAWKTSGGGSIRTLGASKVDADYTADAAVITAAANTKGMVLRTACLMGVGGSGFGFLKAGGTAILSGPVAGGGELPDEIYIPAGVGVDLVRLAGTLHLGLTYDLL